jgi:zinc protease
MYKSMLDVLRIKLRERLREDMGGTYSVSVSGSYLHMPIERYRISIQFGSDPERVEELRNEIFTQIDSLKSFGTTEKYVNKIKESQMRSYETNLKKNEFWLSNLEAKYFHGEPIEDITTYPELVGQLTLEDIQRAAQLYFNTDNYVNVVLYPEKN